MRNPNGIRTESMWSPNASRAGALHSHIHIHHHSQNPASHLATADTREDALATLGLSVAAGLRDAGEKQSTRWLG